MQIKEKYDEGSRTWYISLGGEIDIYNAPDLKEKLHGLIEQNAGDFILDCKDLEYIDSTGLGVLISLLKSIKEFDGKLRITNLKSYIFKIFKITGLDKIFVIEE